MLSAEQHVLERPDHLLTEAEERSLEELTAEEVRESLDLEPVI